MNSFLNRSKPISLYPFDNAQFWIIDLEKIQDEEVQKAESFLDNESRASSKRFIFEEDRRRSTLTQAILRIFLSEHLSLKPHQIEIARTPFGKPFLKNYPIHFNLSHTKKFAFFGIHPSSPIGVDIEFINHDFDFANFAFIHPIEKKQILGEDTSDRFFSLWCAKEAFLKATGTGFAVKELPVFTLKPGLTNIYATRDALVYVYPDLAPNHKLAVCTI